MSPARAVRWCHRQACEDAPPTIACDPQILGERMNKTTLASLALLAGLTAVAAFAAPADQPLPADVVAARAAAAPRVGGVRRAIAKVEGTHTSPGTPLANRYRAYPPSCAADPLPDKTVAPVNSISMPFWARKPSDLNHGYLENVTVSVWRLPCSSSGAATPYNSEGLPNSITLVRIDRATDREGHDDIYPTFPILQVKQGSIDFTVTSGSATARNPKSFPRIASEPNTVRESANYDNAIIDSTTFVLENFPDADAGFFSYGDAFTLRVDPNVPGTVQPVDIAVPAYAAAQTAAAPRPIDGYVSAQWINYALNQSLIMQVAEQLQTDGSTVRQVGVDILLADDNGDPIWLVGNAAFTVGQTSLDIDLIYLGADLVHVPWGKVTISIADCNHVSLDYTARDDVAAPVPVLDGPVVYERLFAPNGMVCE